MQNYVFMSFLLGMGERKHLGWRVHPNKNIFENVVN
jgi:hypothetical protein